MDNTNELQSFLQLCINKNAEINNNIETDKKELYSRNAITTVMSTIEQLQAKAIDEEEAYNAFKGEELVRFNTFYQDTSTDDYEMERIVRCKK